MEAATVVRSSPSIYQPPSLSLKSVHRTDSVCFGPKLNFSNGLRKKYCGVTSVSKNGGRGRRSSVIRASSSGDSPIAPLRLESPIGQFLSQILKSHPHLVPAAVDQQLEQLQTDRDLEKTNPKDEPSNTGTDLVLYRRIAEVKANERKKVLEEILYALVVQKFMDADVSLVPSITPDDSSSSGKVDTWPAEDKKLEQLHSQEALEMIRNHLALILGNRSADPNAVAQISKLQVGQVYAASVMYGYFLKRVDQRFQLEKSMKVLPFGSDDEESDIVQSLNEEMRMPNASENVTEVEEPKQHPEVASWPGGYSQGGVAGGIKSSRLRTYVMSFDPETLQKYATIRSKEALTIDFFFSSRSHALKFMEFVGKIVPIKSRSDKQLVSHDTKSNNYNYKYTFSVEICPICREDLVCLPPKVAVSLGNLGPLVLCSKVSNNIVLVDPFTLRHAFIDADQYWRNPFRALLTCKQLVEYVVLDVDSVSSEVNIAGSKYVLADVQVARVSDFGKNDKMFTMRTHIGHLLNPGDFALGYDLYGANSNDMELDKYKNLVLPDAILVKKSYEEKRLKKRGKPRAWKLKSLNMEVDTSSRKQDEEKIHDEYQKFLEDLEENPEMRFNISLYRNKEYQPSEMASVTDGEDAPSVPLDELLADLDISDDEDEEDDDMRE